MMKKVKRNVTSSAQRQMVHKITTTIAPTRTPRRLFSQQQHLDSKSKFRPARPAYFVVHDNKEMLNWNFLKLYSIDCV